MENGCHAMRVGHKLTQFNCFSYGRVASYYKDDCVDYAYVFHYSALGAVHKVRHATFDHF